MKKFLLLLTAAVAAMSLSAAPVDQATAFRKAKSYLTNKLYAGKIMAPAAVNPVLLKAEIGDVKLNKPVYYIYNTSTTFLVVAGDDRAEEILMVGDAPLKDVNNLPIGMQDMLGIYKNEIMYLHEHPGLKVNPIPAPSNTPQLKAVTVGPLLTALWDQTAPYWNQCKFTYNNKSYQCLTGCPATSASMVLYYWKYPASVAAIPSYTASLELSYYNSVNFTYPALPATTFDWANMKDSYSSYTTAQGNAVATLMRYVGQAEGMMYGTESAGGSGIYVSENYRIADMFKLFGYKSTAQSVNQSSYSSANWAALIQSELIAGRPLVYCAVSGSAGGHAFNVDGYRDSDNKYHVNWGWSGDGNTWCVMNSFSDGSYTFNQSQQAVIGVEPPTVPTVTPELSVNPTSLSFAGSNTGETYTKTFTVTGTDLQGNVNVAVSGSSYYTVSPSTITAAQAANGATVTVTYKPTVSGNHTGTVTISSSGAESKTVALTGSASKVPSITVDPAQLSMTAEVGQTVTSTFVVTGTNLTDNLSLSLSGDDYAFSIDTYTILRSGAANGVTVTVSYVPDEVGTNSAVVTISGGGAQSATVTLNGTATAPVRNITVNPAQLNMTALVGETVTKTFNVKGQNLTGALTLALNDANGVYSLSHTNISASRAQQGVDVTVTYAPQSFGTHNATVTVSGGGADAVTVALNGQADLIKYAPVMLPAVEQFINTTQFRADWTDETPEQNVASYTLEVSPKSTAPVAVDGGTCDLTNIEAVTNDEGQLPNCASTASSYLPEGWTAENYLYVNDGFVISGATTGSSWWSSTTYGAIVSPTLDLTGYDKVTVVARVKSYYPSYYGQAQVRIATGSAYQDYTLGSSDDDEFQEITVVLNCSSSDQVRVQGRANYFALESVVVYAGDITTANMLKAQETGNADYRLITEITPDKCYLVKDLTAYGTYVYRVKSVYADGTESEWSNTQEVTLFDNGHGYQLGDVNHDGVVNISDVTTLIDMQLGNGQGCEICADITGDGVVNISDVTTLIDMQLGNTTAMMKKAGTLRLLAK